MKLKFKFEKADNYKLLVLLVVLTLDKMFLPQTEQVQDWRVLAYITLLTLLDCIVIKRDEQE